MNLALQSISRLLTVTLLALEILLSFSSKNALNTSSSDKEPRLKNDTSIQPVYFSSYS